MFQFIDDNITEYGDLVSVELFGAIGDNINHLIDSMPNGSIIPVLVGLPGVPTPDPAVWKECDGTDITDQLSPLRNNLAPNFADQGRYMRCFDTIGQVGNYYGAHYKNLSHSHGQHTGTNPSQATDADTDNDFWTMKDHNHPINPDLGVYNFEPVHFRVTHYVKINDCNVPEGGKFRDLEKDMNTSVAQSLWLKAAKTINAIDKIYPVGMLLFFNASQSNLPALPDSNYWQLCDGSTVTNVNSPLNGQTLPDLNGKFLRHPTTLEPALTTGGTDFINLSHNHGGQTGSADDRNDFELDNGGEREEAGSHTHSISGDLTTFDIKPLYHEVQIYVRIV